MSDGFVMLYCIFKGRVETIAEIMLSAKSRCNPGNNPGYWL